MYEQGALLKKLLHVDWLLISATQLISVDECWDFNIDSPVTDQQVLQRLFLKHLNSCSGELLMIMTKTIEYCASLHKLFCVYERFSKMSKPSTVFTDILGDFHCSFFFFYVCTFKLWPIQNPTFLTMMNRIIGTLRHIWIRCPPKVNLLSFFLYFPVFWFNLMSRKPRCLVFWCGQNYLVSSPQDRWRWSDRTQTVLKNTICMN